MAKTASTRAKVSKLAEDRSGISSLEVEEAQDAAATASLHREIQRLRQDVAELKARLGHIDQQAERPEETTERERPWVRIAATVATTFLVGKLFRALKLPAATAVAIPMISSEVGRRFF